MLTLAGIYQWTPLKRACLATCQSPMAFVTRRWRSGNMGAFRMGAEHGVYCVGCCWALMLLLFAGGVMNLTVIAALTIVRRVREAGAPRPVGRPRQWRGVDRVRCVDAVVGALNG